MVYTMASKRFVNYLVEQKVASSERKDIYAYHMERLISTIGNLLILLLVSTVLGELKEVTIVILFYSTLRSSSGGAHAKNHCRCFSIYLIIVAAIICLAELISGQRCFSIMTITMLAVSNLIVFKYAPVDCPNRRFADEEKIKKRKISLITAVVETIIILATLTLTDGIDYYICIATLAFLAQSCTLLPILNK